MQIVQGAVFGLLCSCCMCLCFVFHLKLSFKLVLNQGLNCTR